MSSVSQKLNITVACGGVSTEHEISIISAQNVINALNSQKYSVSILYITQDGSWYWTENTEHFCKLGPQALIENKILKPVTVRFGKAKQRAWHSLTELNSQYPVDCVLPILHGTQGEDGTIQGLFELLNLPYVGAGVLGSAICMDKVMTKQLLRAAQIPTTEWESFDTENAALNRYMELSLRWQTQVLFVKAVSLGSSVGIYRVSDDLSYRDAVKEAFQYDRRIMVEPAIVGREIECAVLGNSHPKASLPGEIVVQKDRHEFYSYVAKYHDPESARIIAPANLPEPLIKQIQQMAIQAFQVVRGEGMARVDFFLPENQKPIINELNTIPGFTTISLYPKMWEASGLNYADLLEQLIELAMELHKKQRCVTRAYSVQQKLY